MLSDVCDAGHEEFSTGLSSCLSCRWARCSHEALVGLRGAWRWGFAVARVQCVGRGLLIAPFLGFPYLILLSFFKFACLGADCREGEGAARPMAGATLPPAGFPKPRWEHGFGACSRGVLNTNVWGGWGGGDLSCAPQGVMLEARPGGWPCTALRAASSCLEAVASFWAPPSTGRRAVPPHYAVIQGANKARLILTLVISPP